jgi:hypothetical protein
MAVTYHELSALGSRLDRLRKARAEGSRRRH